MGSLAVDSAANRLSGSQDLLDDSAELPGHGPGPHHTGGLVDVVHGDVAAVLDVLHLLTVPGGQRGGGSNLASNGSEVDVLHLIGIKLGRHLGLGELSARKCSESGRNAQRV